MSKRFRKEKCVSCSLCIVLCPHEAFQLHNGSVEYVPSKCMSCEHCGVGIGCPRRALET